MSLFAPRSIALIHIVLGWSPHDERHSRVVLFVSFAILEFIDVTERKGLEGRVVDGSHAKRSGNLPHS